MTPIQRNFKLWDMPLLLSALAMVGFGLVGVYSVAIAKGSMVLFYKQLIFLAVGLVFMTLFSLFDWRVLKARSYLVMIVYLVCLILLFGLFFVSGHRGIQGWYDFGLFYFNPIELLKIVLLIILAKYFSNRHAEMYNFWHVVISGIYVALPSILIFMQPDIGSILVIMLLWGGMLLVSGIKPKHLIVLIVLGLVLISVSWGFLLKDYQKQRIVNFLNPEANLLTTGWNQQQMIIAIGSGGLLGKGIANGSQTQLGYLPEAHTDFIFCVIAEEMGLAGVLLLFAVMLYFLWRVMKLAIGAPDNFSRLFAAGFAILFFAQAAINLAMSLRIFPIVGIPLPLISYGGGNLIFLFMGIGILQSISANAIIN